MKKKKPTRLDSASLALMAFEKERDVMDGDTTSSRVIFHTGGSLTGNIMKTLKRHGNALLFISSFEFAGYGKLKGSSRTDPSKKKKTF